MSSTQHPDAKLTIREAWKKYYDKSDLSSRTLRWFNHNFTVWEKTSGNPPVGEITTETAAVVRTACLALGLAPTTINQLWQTVRSTLRRLSPEGYGNPFGVGVIPGPVPAMRRVKVVRNIPRRIPLDTISRLYVACRSAQFPRRAGIPPADLWRTLLVLAYCTGLRKGDLLNIQTEDIDFENATLDMRAGKTGKADRFPLNRTAMEHVRRIRGPHKLLLPGFLKRGGRFYKQLHELFEQAEIPKKEWFGLQNIRQTSASEAEKFAAVRHRCCFNTGHTTLPDGSTSI